MTRIHGLRPGTPDLLGATLGDGGVNFTLFSYHASQVDLLLFDRPDQAQPSAAFRLDPDTHRTGSYWHIYVPGLEAGQLYGYRLHGPYQPERGLRFDPAKLLLDPYARAVVDDHYDRAVASRYGLENLDTAMKGVVVDPDDYDWEGDQPLKRSFNDAAIYEMHVRGFTRHPSSGLPQDKRGTYAGLIQKIPYLQQLGVRIVELLPVFQFDRQSAPGGRPNYWGYEPVAFFAPHRAYSSRQDWLGPVDEFRDMVKALHRANIEVILDVVYNHTAEDSHDGPTISMRGIDNRVYYILDPANPAEYINDSGVGNTLNGNHTIVRRLIMDSLRYWVLYMHVDGFRFDLASVLSRGQDDQVLKVPPILWDIDSDPVLAGTKIIAEAWDAAGLYQVGSFVGDRWAVWNGRYRDTVRRFVTGDAGTVVNLADALSGSFDVFSQLDRDPMRSVNFVTAHDGFTLNDLVSYSEKHNEANGEDNRDGNDQNDSWNCGLEGPTDDPDVKALRERQIRNFHTTLFMSQGRPMFLMGDEVRHTQGGNNNAYSQDNEISWFDWDRVDEHEDLLRFVSGLLRFRQGSQLFRDRRYWFEPKGTDIIWHGVRLNEPDWGENSHSLAFELLNPTNPAVQEHLYVLLNAYWEPLEFELPELLEGRRWARLVDTGRPSPEDFVDPPEFLSGGASTYVAQPRSAVILVAGNITPGENGLYGQ
jgi:glycogen operon protein